jgi:hypothetical protein
MNKKRWLYIYESFGKWLVDLSKLGFGSLILGTIIKGDLPQFALLLAGGVFTLITAVLGFLLVSLGEE